jgi:hypothetical protein
MFHIVGNTAGAIEYQRSVRFYLKRLLYLGGAVNTVIPSQTTDSAVQNTSSLQDTSPAQATPPSEDNSEQHTVPINSVRPAKSDGKPMPPELLYQLMKAVIDDSKATSKEKMKLLDELRRNNGLDRWSSRSAIWLLGAIVPIALICVVYLSRLDIDSTGVMAIGTTAVGAIAGLLSSKD